MVRGVLVDFNRTLAGLSSWGSSHQEAFERHGHPAVAARWGEGWLVVLPRRRSDRRGTFPIGLGILTRPCSKWDETGCSPLW